MVVHNVEPAFSIHPGLHVSFEVLGKLIYKMDDEIVLFYTDRHVFVLGATGLDLAEFSIHLPQLHYVQQQWRLETYQGAMVERPRQD